MVKFDAESKKLSLSMRPSRLAGATEAVAGRASGAMAEEEEEEEEEDGEEDVGADGE